MSLFTLCPLDGTPMRDDVDGIACRDGHIVTNAQLAVARNRTGFNMREFIELYERQRDEGYLGLDALVANA